MKRLLGIILLAFALHSCMPDGYYNTSYPLYSTFEYTDVSLAKDSVFTYTKVGYFPWIDIVFAHRSDPQTKEFWGGFALSALKGDPVPSTSGAGDVSGGTEDTNNTESGSKGVYLNEEDTPGDDGETTPETPGEITPPDNTFRVCYGQGARNSKFYMVYYDNPDASKKQPFAIYFANKNYGTCTFSNCKVNNTKLVKEAVEKSFEKGDRLILSMTGFLKGVKTGDPATIDLANYSTDKDSIITTWTNFDLSKLGSVDSIVVNITGPQGKDIPQYFCLDDVESFINISY